MMPAIEILSEAIGTERLTFGFNQFDGNSDIQLSIDLTVEDTDQNWVQVKNRKAIGQYATCIGALSDVLQGK